MMNTTDLRQKVIKLISSNHGFTTFEQEADAIVTIVLAWLQKNGEDVLVRSDVGDKHLKGDQMRVFSSRYTPGLKPGDGDKINWEHGERTRVLQGPDKDRIFIVMSESKRHPQLPPDIFVREGYFEDDPKQTRYAKGEANLWFVVDPAWSSI